MTEAPVRDLDRLLREARPVRHPGAFAYCPLPAGAPLAAEAIALFREAEGDTVILPLASARAQGLGIAFECAWITLSVHSALEAVGLTAAVARTLAEAGIACNVMAALHHDHLFVPLADAERAMAVLTGLAQDR